MRPELEAVVAADEEARSRLSSAEERAKRDVTAVRAEFWAHAPPIGAA